MTGNDDEPTTMHLLKGQKDRFDSLQRQLEADRDESLNNTLVLKELLDAYEEDDAAEEGR